MIRKNILVKGLVQGVGFRPFVYKIAIINNLKGYIKNSSLGVTIEVEGEEENIQEFIETLKHKGPKALDIKKIIIKNKDIVNYKTFEIG